MDRYLFRGLRTDGEGWVFGGYAYNTFAGISYIILDTIHNEKVDVISETVGQLHNKLSRCEINGKDVFVGDKLIITWYNGKLAPKQKNFTLRTIEYWVENILSCEVIGSIYEDVK